MSVRVEIPKEQIEAFCRRNQIRRLAFFGSVLGDDFTPESDVDVLVGHSRKILSLESFPLLTVRTFIVTKLLKTTLQAAGLAGFH